MQVATEMFIQIGRRRFQVASLDAAADLYCAARDKSGRGASGFPSAPIVDASGREIAHISYNGRVWTPEQWATL